MSLPRAWTRLPGPADFLEAIVEDLTDRSSVLVGLPDKTPSAAVSVEIAESVKRNGLGQWEPVQLNGAYATTPLEFVVQRFDSRDAGNFVLWIDATNEGSTAEAWADHARRFAELEESPRICIAANTLCAEACREDKRLRRRLWRDFVTASDSRALVERLARRFERSPAHTALKSALIAELTGPDLAAAERLGRTTLGRILTSGNHSPQRIWAAQVGVLLPLAERERRRLLEVHRDLWILPHTREEGKEIQRPEDLEIGDMAFQAKTWDRAFQTERRRLDWLHRVRNALAHNQIVPWSTLVSPTALEIVDFRE